MRAVFATSSAVIVCFAAQILPAQQGPWVGPKPPCELSAGHFRVSSGQEDLKLAQEKPGQRDRMLKQAQEVLVRTIRDDKQDQNPAAWYYLGRYYYDVGDAIGADTAFARTEKLAPQCKADIATYRVALGTDLLGRGTELWQADKTDSAAILLRQSYAVNPADPKPLFTLGDMYSAKQQDDSAIAVLRRAVKASAGDTAFAAERRRAFSTIARVAMAGVQNDPAIQRWRATRYSRDSVRAAVANDSTVLARIFASSASRRARNAHLMPADQKQFSADSSSREESLKRNRDAQAAIQQRVPTDSAAAQPGFVPAIAAYQDVVAAEPTDPDQATALANLYLQAGRTGEAAGAFDSLLNHAAQVPPDQLVDIGRRLTQAGVWTAGARILNTALTTNPYNRSALFELASGAVARRDTATAVSASQRLVALDPANVQALRIASQAWDLRGRKDSAQRYRVLADSVRTVDISVASMIAMGDAVTVTVVATNLHAAPSQPFGLVFELLDAKGTVVVTQPADVPALPAGGNRQFEVKGTGKGIVGWRYRLR